MNKSFNKTCNRCHRRKRTKSQNLRFSKYHNSEDDSVNYPSVIRAAQSSQHEDASEDIRVQILQDSARLRKRQRKVASGQQGNRHSSGREKWTSQTEQAETLADLLSAVTLLDESSRQAFGSDIDVPGIYSVPDGATINETLIALRVACLEWMRIRHLCRKHSIQPSSSAIASLWECMLVHRNSNNNNNNNTPTLHPNNISRIDIRAAIGSVLGLHIPFANFALLWDVLRCGGVNVCMSCEQFAVAIFDKSACKNETSRQFNMNEKTTTVVDSFCSLIIRNNWTLEEIFGRLDRNQDGRISLAEFLHVVPNLMFRSGIEPVPQRQTLAAIHSAMDRTMIRSVGWVSFADFVGQAFLNRFSLLEEQLRSGDFEIGTEMELRIRAEAKHIKCILDEVCNGPNTKCFADHQQSTRLKARAQVAPGKTWSNTRKMAAGKQFPRDGRTYRREMVSSRDCDKEEEKEGGRLQTFETSVAMWSKMGDKAVRNTFR